MGEDIGKLIKEMRNAVGMSQRDLAEKLDVSPQQVQRYEEGEGLTATRLIQIAEAFGVPVNVFMNDDGADGQRGSGYMRLSTDETWLILLYRSLRSERLKEGFIGMLESLRKLRN